MYTFYYCSLNGISYNAKIPLQKKEELIQKYHLQIIGNVKEYWENNVQIIFLPNQKNFNYIEDLSIEYDEKNNLLIQEYNSKPCQEYNFFKVDQEEQYILYENKLDNVIIQLKEFQTFLSINYICKEKTDFTNKFFF